MQKVIFVEGNNLDEINKLLAKGWRVVNISAASNGNSKGMFGPEPVYAYFVLEKKEEAQ